MNTSMPRSKSQLAILLSKLAVFEKPLLMKEQYATDSESAAEAIWFAYMNGDIEGKAVADLGCGTGLLGIAALLLEANKVYFVDSDKDAIVLCGKNIAASADKAQVAAATGPSRRKSTWEKASRTILIAADIADFHHMVDTVVQNPPFGTKTKHADRQFLLKAFKVADTIYSFHKIETADFVKKIAADNGFAVTNIIPLQLQLKKTYEFHRSRMKRIEVGLFRIVKQPQVD